MNSQLELTYDQLLCQWLPAFPEYPGYPAYPACPAQRGTTSDNKLQTQ